MLRCAIRTGAMGKLVGYDALYPCPTSCDGADFSIQVVSEEFMGKVRFVNYWVHGAYPTFSDRQ